MRVLIPTIMRAVREGGGASGGEAQGDGNASGGEG